jgi:hypothetical protein
MVKITIEIPDELEFLQERIPSAKWSFIATRVLQDRIKEIAEYNERLSRSEATEEDVKKLADEIKEGVWDRYSSS